MYAYVLCESMNFPYPMLIESELIRNNALYSIACVRIVCSYENITIWCYHQVFLWKETTTIFYREHPISVLGKGAIFLFYTKYLIYTHVINSFIIGCQLFRNGVYNVTHWNYYVLILMEINKSRWHIAYIVDDIIILSQPWFYNIICLMLGFRFPPYFW